MTDELAFAPALELAARIRAKEVSPLELTQLYLSRIERLDPTLNAFVTVDVEGALASARAAEATPSDAPFHGVPISIKDLHDTAGLRTTYSSKAFADHVPKSDTTVVRRIRDAGFLVLGKTNAPELGTTPTTESELNGVCRNPWDTSRTPGGSSGGAAAALAAGLCPLAHGTDGGGSIRTPASCCGVVGLKPSRGRVSPAPRGQGLLALATSGPLARTVADAAALLDAIAGAEPGDTYAAAPPPRPFLAEVGVDPGRLRIALATASPLQLDVDPACSAAADACAHLLAELGHDVVEATPSWSSEELMPLFTRLWQLGPALAGVPLHLLEPVNRALAEDAAATSSVELGEAVMRLEKYARTILSSWGETDVLVTPTLALPPVPIGWADEEPDPRKQFRRGFHFNPFGPIANLTGQPAVSVPLGEAAGLPVGVQLIGRPYGEATLIRLTAQLERARPWADRRPPVS